MATSIQTLNLNQQEKQAALGPLAKALRDLEIEPFDPKAVAAYKAQKMEETFRNLHPSLAGEVNETDPEWVNWVRLYALRTVGEGATIRYYHSYRPGMMPWFIALLWRRIQLRALNLAVAHALGIPEYVLHKAELISGKIPGVQFEVDELRGDKATYDPFLVARLGDEEFYLEVWGADEREFRRD